MARRVMFGVVAVALPLVVPSCLLDRGAGLTASDGGAAGTGGEGNASSPGGMGGSGGTPTGEGGTGEGGDGGLGGGEPSCVVGDCVELPAGAEPVLRAMPNCAMGWTAGPTRFVATDPGCEACTCGAPDGNCSLSMITTHGGVGCGNGNTINVPLLDPTTCLTLTNGPDAYTTGAEVPNEGKCDPNPSAPLPPETVELCEPNLPLDSCGDTGLCAPPDASLCVVLPDGQSCPPSLPVTRPIADGASDGRTCDCDCGPSTGLTCSGTQMDVYDDDNCSSFAGSVPANNPTCFVIQGMSNQSISLTQGTWTGGPCAPIDNHGGTLDFSGPRVLCCAD